MAPLAQPRPALFLDRDGVIIRDTGYLSEPNGVVLIPEMTRLMQHANQLGVPVLVVTNQSGIDRGLFDWASFAVVEKAIAETLAEFGARSDATAACPFHPDYTNGYGEEHAHWRKPGPGLITALGGTLGISLPGSWLIGDNRRDIMAARNAGLAAGILIGRHPIESEEEDPRWPRQAPFMMKTAETPSLAVDQILETDLFAAQ